MAGVAAGLKQQGSEYLKMLILDITENEIQEKAKKRHVLYLSGKPMMPHLLRCQRFAIPPWRDGFIFGVLNLHHPRLLQH